jgi:hypothetical protein
MNATTNTTRNGTAFGATSRTTRHLSRSLVATGLLAAALVGGGGAAQAQGGNGGDRVLVSGTCTGATHQKLVAKRDDGRIEVEVEIDSNVAGQTWHVTMADNGSRFLSLSQVTLGRSGSFEITRTIANRAGADRIGAVATNAGTGERCSAALVVQG